MKVFLITDSLVNKQGVDISACPQGSWPELIAFLEQLAAGLPELAYDPQ